MKKGRRFNYDDVVVDIDAVREQRRESWSNFLDGLEDGARNLFEDKTE